MVFYTFQELTCWNCYIACQKHRKRARERYSALFYTYNLPKDILYGKFRSNENIFAKTKTTDVKSNKTFKEFYCLICPTGLKKKGKTAECN